MKTRAGLIASTILWLLSANLYAQVGIGTNTPAASAALEVASNTNNKGILIPRITATQKDAISNPAEGLMIYQTSAPVGFYYFTNNSWRLIITQTDLDTKVTKLSGKELSSNDYTSAEKTKLAAITGTNTGDQDLSALATIASVALKANAADLTSGLATKVDQVNGKDLSSNDYTTIEKTKLAAITGSNTGDQTTITGNAATATKLAAPKNINGVAFDGSSAITVTADANTLTGTTLNPAIVNSSLSSLGTLTNLTVTNPIVASITGNSATVSTNASLTGVVTSIGNTTAIANGAISNVMLANGAVANLTGTNSGDQTATTVINVAQGNISATNVQAAINELDTEKAPLASPGLIGIPTAPTADAGTNTTQIATTAFVSAATTVAGSNFVDLSTNQTIAGAKAFSSDAIVSGITVGVGGGTLTTSQYNTALGLNALVNNTSWGNTAIGRETLTVNANSNNTAVGYQALKLSVNGNNNNAVGSSALARNTDGNINNALGSNALGNNINGSENTAIGTNVLLTNTAGNQNTAIGNLADVSSSNLTNATAIGYNAKVAGSNTIQLGNTSVTNIKTSGTITAGDMTYPKMDGAAGQVLTTNGQGTASWQPNTDSNVPTFAQSITSMTSLNAKAESTITIGGLTFQYSLDNGLIGAGKIQIFTTSNQEYQVMYSKNGGNTLYTFSRPTSNSTPVDLCDQTLSYYDHLSVDLFRVNSGMGHSFHLDAFVDGWGRLVLRVTYF